MDENLRDCEVAPDRPSVLHRSTAELDPSARRILDAAERVFVERGYGAVTMDELAAFGRTSKRTIYKRSGDKAGLFRAVMDGRTAKSSFTEKQIVAIVRSRRLA